MLDPMDMTDYDLPILTTDKSLALSKIQEGYHFVIYNGPCEELLSSMGDGQVDLLVTSPPYFVGKEYDRSYKIEDFYTDIRNIVNDVVRVVNETGNICWQVGNHVSNSTIFPLDFAIHDIMRDVANVYLRNRIIWQFGHGIHAKKRFSGRHETILWYGKSTQNYFDLDAVRVAQKYPGKRHYKGPQKGSFSGNPLGKNPSDVWDIPNVKANHCEKTGHPCQFPVALVQRLVRALSPEGGVIMDPFSGSGSTGIAAVLDGRRFIGSDTSAHYCKIAIDRYLALKAGVLKIRPIDKDIHIPSGRESVAKKPDHFLTKE